MDNILIIFHSKNGTVEKMAHAVKKGVEKTKGYSVKFKRAQDATWQDLKEAVGIAIGTPDFFDYMAGTVKDFFDRTFYSSQSKIKGSLVADVPCVFFASGGTGGMPAIESLKCIAQAFKFKIIDYVAVSPKLTAEQLLQCEALGEKLGKAALEKLKKSVKDK